MQSVEDVPLANNFIVRWPRGMADLNHCFTLLESSPYYDGSASREEVTSAWEALLTEGTGNIIIIENPSYKETFGSSFVCFYFTAFITKNYAARIVQNPQIQQPGMDFLRRYHDSTFHRQGENPAETAKTIHDGYAKNPDYGVYFFSFMCVWSSNIEPAKLSQDDVTRFAITVQTHSARVHGTFNYHAWFNDALSERIKEYLLSAGHHVLREYESNRQAPLDDLKRYIICVTRDAAISHDLKIPDDTPCAIKPGAWAQHLFFFSEPRAKLSITQKKVAYLMVLGYTRDEIAKVLYELYNDSQRAPSLEQLAKDRQNVTAHQTAICEKLRQAGYPLPDCSHSQLVEVIRANLHETRPVIVPLYPEIRSLPIS